jgi:hypothetical protein
LDLTLVAFYGPKPPAMVELVDALQTELRSQLGDAFTAYDMEQVHGTLVGLEGRQTGTGIQNTNLINASGESSAMDLEGIFHFLLNTPLLPLHIRIGGFVHSRVYPFTSHNLHPYVRSFSLCDQIAVVIGWPAKAKTFPMVLDKLRRLCTNYNVLHRYHEKPSDIDNDFFFVLGHIERNLITEEQAESVQRHVREWLSSREPLDIEIGHEQFSVVAYSDRRLPRPSSIAYSLTEAPAKLVELKGLYQKRQAH